MGLKQTSNYEKWSLVLVQHKYAVYKHGFKNFLFINYLF